MIKNTFKLQFGKVLLMILMLCESLSCQRSDYCGKYGKHFGIYSQCELNQGPCYGDTYCKGNLVCGHWNCGNDYRNIDNCCKCNCKGLEYTGLCDSEDGTCHKKDNGPYGETSNNNVIHIYDDYDPNYETSNDNLHPAVFAIVVYFMLLFCVCSFFCLLDKEKL